MRPANFEGEAAAHVLSAVFKIRTVAFVGWASPVPSWGKFLVWETCTDVGDGRHGVGRRRASVVNTGT